MLDTTDPTYPILHFLQGDLQADGGDTKADLTSQSDPLVPYHAPGTLGEESGPRKYSFLLYDQIEGVGIDYDTSTFLLDRFDQDLFESDNGLTSAIAGLAISVDITDNYNDPNSPGWQDPPSHHPPHTTPNRSITTTKTIGGDGGGSGEPTKTSTSKRSVPSVWTISGTVISGYTPDAIPYTTPAEGYSGMVGGGKAMVTAGGGASTAGAAPAAGFSRGGNFEDLRTLALMVTAGAAMAVAVVLM
jgi:hypothetical protein